jgi:hypothetical protein
MTGEEMERAIEFLLASQAKNSTDIAITNEVVNKLAETVAQDRRENREQLEAYRQETREQLEAYRLETREAINNLIIANEVTRDLAERVAALAISTSHRVTALEAARED